MRCSRGVGLYGTLGYLTSQRTQEFGVRLALGASAASILRLVVREGCLFAGWGIALGVAGALAVTSSLRGLLYGVSPVDGLTISSVVVLVTAVALVAVGWPAWRAARVDPSTRFARSRSLITRAGGRIRGLARGSNYSDS